MLLIFSIFTFYHSVFYINAKTFPVILFKKVLHTKSSAAALPLHIFHRIWHTIRTAKLRPQAAALLRAVRVQHRVSTSFLYFIHKKRKGVPTYAQKYQ
jgi:hypothetical protein